jgi:Amt family ammonium transporter
MDFQGIGRVATNTTLAACSAGLAAMFWAFPQTKKWDLGFTVNGFLAGLVAITCPCYWVTPTGAILLGAVAGVVVVLGVNFLEWLRIDDPIGAVPVHGFAGIWGTWSLGLFAAGSFGAAAATGSDPGATRLAGLFYGGGFTLLKAQMIGNGCITLATFGVSLAMMFALKKAGILRISREGELEGLDIHEHGIPPYPEFALVPSATPHGPVEAAHDSAHAVAPHGNLESVPH